MAFDSVGEGVGVEHNGAQNFLAAKGDNPEPLPYPTGPHLLGIEAAPLDSGPGQGFFDESSLTCARLAGQQECPFTVPWLEAGSGPFFFP